MTTTIDVSKNPVFLGTWLTNEPKNGDDSWLAWGVFNGAADAVQVYSIEAARIRASAEFNDYANVALKRQAALAAFTKALLAGRTARYQESLDRVAATIATNEATLTAKSKIADSPRIAAIWAHLDRLDADDMQRAIDDALRAGDSETIGSVLGAPRVFAFVKDSDRTRIADAYLRAKDESAYNALVDLRTAFQVAQGAWDRAQSFIRADARLAAFESTGA
jgi:hypothetical protein